MFSLVLLFSIAGATPVPAKQVFSPTLNEVGAQLHVLRSDENGLSLELTSPGYAFEPVELGGSNYERLNLPGAAYTQQAGLPQLPLVSALIGVPHQAEVRLKVISENTVPLPGEHRLPPAPNAIPPEQELQPGELAYVPDVRAYASLEAYPQEAARLADDAWVRDQRLVRIELYPFQYIPAAGQIRWRPRLRVEVSFESGADNLQLAELSTPTTLPRLDTALDRLLINAEQARSWRGLPVSNALLDQPLQSDPAYRVSIQQDGLYRLTYETLANVGMDVAHLDPVNLQLTCQGQEVAVYVANSDGDQHRFSPGEYLAFYGQKFYGDRLATLYQSEDDHWLSFTTQDTSGANITWSPHMNAAMLEKYTDENVYWLRLGDAPGARMPQVNAIPADAPVPQTYTETVRAEQQVYWKTTLFNSEDTFYWDYINTDTAATRTYTLPLSAVAPGDYQATLRGVISAESYLDGTSPDHHTAFYLNDPSLLQPVLDSYWDGKSRYAFEVQVPQAMLASGDNQLGLQVYPTPVLVTQKLYFDYYEIEYQRLFKAQDNQIEFGFNSAGQWKYQVSGFTSNDLYVLDITQPLAPIWFVNWLKNFDVLNFQVNQSGEARYYAGTIADVPLERITFYDPPDLSQPTQYVIITHADFLAPAQRLAAYHQSQGLSTKVIDVQDLYNQFNFGIYNPLAIKNYLRYAFQQWATPPEYVVLVGDGTWNFKGSPRYFDLPIYMPPFLSWVDPWNGEVDSANLLATVVGDDILPDVLISRILVNSSAELDAVVDKIIAYEAAPRQDWQRSFVFVADNVPDPAGDFVKFSNDLIRDYQEPGFSITRIYENDFGCKTPVVSAACDPVTYAITNTLNLTGTLLLNYIGHGAIDRWSGESILINSDLAWLNNGEHLPVALSMTCLDGYWIHPGIVPNNMPLQSLIEEALRASARGTVASFSPTGFGVVTGHDSLHRGFYEALLRQGIWNLGEAAEFARLNLFASGGNFDLIHTYTVFGDPALRLPSPYGFEQTPPSQYDSGPPGAVLTYYLQVTNTGVLTDTISFALSGNLWQATIPATVTLQAGDSQSIPITVQIPPDANDEQNDTLNILATSQGDRSQQASSKITTTAYLYGVKMTPEPPNKFAAPGDVVTYTLTVYNNGAFEDTFNLELQGTAWETTLVGSEQVGPLLPGESDQRLLRVEVPPDAADGASDAAIVIASSQGDPRRTAQVNLATWAYHYRFQLYPMQPSQAARQGELVTYLIRLDNTSRLADRFDIQLQGNQWQTTLEPTTVELFPLNSSNLELQVQVPLVLPLGAEDTAQITAVSRGDPTLSLTVQVTTRLSRYQLFMPEIER